MGLKKYEQEIAAAAAHPDREHAVTVLESLARSLRRHEWPPERRGAAYDLAERSEAEARRLAPAPAAEQDIAAAQEIANREGYSVHVGCGGEVWYGTCCNGCDRAVLEGDVVKPEQAARCDEGECEWSGTIEAARDAAIEAGLKYGITMCPVCCSLAVIEGPRARRGKGGTR